MLQDDSGGKNELKSFFRNGMRMKNTDITMLATGTGGDD